MKSRFPAFALVTFVAMTSINWSPEELGIRLSDPEAVKQHGTEMTAVMDRKLPQGRNVLWCATFQIAWDQACGRFGRPMKLKPESQLADSLNQSAFDMNWVDADSVFTTQGLLEDGVLDRIDQGVRGKSGRPSKILERVKQGSAAGDLVFYAMLHKELEFSHPFGKLGAWQVGGRKVPWFGFAPGHRESARLRQQVRVHRYESRNDFVIELLGRQAGDQLLLAKLPEVPETMNRLGEAVLKAVRTDAPQAKHEDLLAVPNVVVDEDVAFTELHGSTVVGSGRFIRQALQSIEFHMDEKGVKLHSEAEISFGCAASPRVEPRLMVLDPPFAIVMRRKGAPKPYFAAWLANADLLGNR